MEGSLGGVKWTQPLKFQSSTVDASWWNSSLFLFVVTALKMTFRTVDILL